MVGAALTVFVQVRNEVLLGLQLPRELGGEQELVVPLPVVRVGGAFHA